MDDTKINNKCEQCEFYDLENKTPNNDCPNKDKEHYDFSQCSDFLIDEKLIHF